MNDGNFEGTKETFEGSIIFFKSQEEEKNYDFLTKSGNKFQKVVYKMCKRMFREEEFPEAFNKTTLHIIFKGKGNKETLSDNRFIHCK